MPVVQPEPTISTARAPVASSMTADRVRIFIEQHYLRAAHCSVLLARWTLTICRKKGKDLPDPLSHRAGQNPSTKRSLRCMAPHTAAPSFWPPYPGHLMVVAPSSPDGLGQGRLALACYPVLGLLPSPPQHAAGRGFHYVATLILDQETPAIASPAFPVRRDAPPPVAFRNLGRY